MHLRKSSESMDFFFLSSTLDSTSTSTHSNSLFYNKWQQSDVKTQRENNNKVKTTTSTKDVFAMCCVLLLLSSSSSFASIPLIQ